MLDAWIGRRLQPVMGRAGRRLARAGVRADTLTWAGFAIGLGVVPLLAGQDYGAALLPLAANRVLDGLDGAVARATTPTDRGGFLDIVLDFVFYAAVPLGFALADPTRNALPAAALLASFIGSGGSFLAYALMAAKRGLPAALAAPKAFVYVAGLTEGTETIVAFALFCLWPQAFPALAYGFALLCAITTASRIAAGWRAFDDPPA